MDAPAGQPDVLDVNCRLGRSLGEPLGALCSWAQEHLAELDAHRAVRSDRTGR